MGSLNKGIDGFGEGHPAGDGMPDGDVIEGIGGEVGLHQDGEAINAGDVAAPGGFDGEEVVAPFIGEAIECLDLHGVTTGEGHYLKCEFALGELSFDSFPCGFEVGRIFFDADKIPAGAEACDGRGG